MDDDVDRDRLWKLEAAVILGKLSSLGEKIATHPHAVVVYELEMILPQLRQQQLRILNSKAFSLSEIEGLESDV